ncbi:hypothetical protein GUJ93_ZPchr0005g15326 [Zizania palustris]|uniref:Auxin-responsive protein n=1 Tax=Zizania palustris TaxID=103762 RepID=A0A8J5S2H0_ZIZPA|nr:hypothetical protein GUJ93_ZPchr0005g15326 [Zizania palustris]
MSVETDRSSTESSAASGLDFEDTVLTLRLPGSSSSSSSDIDRRSPDTESPPSPKARVVGWPPVRAFRKSALAAASKAKFVKVAVDGAPYLRKVDLEAYSGYDQLLAALQDKFFSHFTIRKLGNEEMKLVDAVTGTEYVPTYEDKDGDWMLVGDVPWNSIASHDGSECLWRPANVFVLCANSSEAVDLAPRAA